MWDYLGMWSVVAVSNYSCLQFHLMSPLHRVDAFGFCCPVLGVELRTGLSLALQGAGKAQHLQDSGVLGIP